MAINPSKDPKKNVTPDELKELSDWWQEHGNLFSTILLVAAIAIVGVRYWRSHVAARAEQASAAVSSATSLGDLETVVTEYASTPEAPLVLLRIASQLCRESRFEAAAERYGEFLAKHAGHELAPVARLGVAFTDEAQGKFDAALKAYEDFLADDPGYLESVALLGKARVLALLDRVEEARTVLDSVTAKKPNTAWAASAEDLKAALPRMKFVKPAAFADQLDAVLSGQAPAAEAPAAPEAAEEAPAAEAPAAEAPAAPEPEPAAAEAPAAPEAAAP